LAWRIELTATAAKQLSKLDKGEAKRITTFLRQRLAVLDDPRSTDKRLTGPQIGAYWCYRVDADLNGDGIVNSLDLSQFKLLFFKAPGPGGVVQ
jgi:hypothetical protein